jgi:3-oxoacyl-[acyl-carrier-protein] synthase III
LPFFPAFEKGKTVKDDEVPRNLRIDGTSTKPVPAIRPKVLFDLGEQSAKLGGRAFPDVTASLGWSKDHVDHVFCHQVGRQVNDAFYREMGLDFDKDYAIYKRYGNMVSVALPAALAIGAEEKGIKPGEKVLLTAFGSGLNTRFLGFEW